AAIARIDLDQLVARVDLNAMLDRVDPNRLLDRVDPDRLLDRVDPNRLLDRVDPDRLLDRVDPDRLLDRVDPDRLLDRVDPDRLLDRVDPNRLLDRVDPNRLLDRVDPSQLLDRVDPNQLLDRVDVDELMSRVDIRALAARSGVADLVAESTSQMATSVLDVARRQVAGLDTLVNRVVGRVLRRDPARQPLAPAELVAIAPPADEIVAPRRTSITGHYAGVVPRALAAMLDVLVVVTTFSLSYAGVGLLTSAFFGVSIGEHRSGPAATWAFVAWAFCYVFGTIAVSGRTLGKALVGLRVVCASGTTVTAGRAFVRAIALPVSAVLFGLGFALSVVQPRRRALHDLIAGTAVVHDWGDRPAELSAPLSAFLQRASTRT
uniref:RDD family protein n=1 Tax=Intrasporangium sp. TaxID=1925024 RepID=UPI0032216A4E